MTRDAMGKKPVRYAFATRDDSEHAPGTKVCPRCGQELFADMDVCYGCLYDFSKDSRGKGGVPAVSSSQQAQAGHDPLEGIALDEPTDEELSPDASEGKEADGSGEGGASPEDEAAGDSLPRHRRRPPSADDTVDLGAGQDASAKTRPKSDGALCVSVRCGGMEVLLPLAADGLLVGRDPQCDVVLTSRAVSRRHVRILPSGEAACVRDLGATNPAEVRGTPVVGEVPLAVGEEVIICDATMRLVGARETPARVA